MKLITVQYPKTRNTHVPNYWILLRDKIKRDGRGFLLPKIRLNRSIGITMRIPECLVHCLFIGIGI